MMTLCQIMETLESNQQQVSGARDIKREQSDDAPTGDTATGRSPGDTAIPQTDENNNDAATGNANVSKRPRRACREYNLRDSSKINRIETERRRSEPKTPKKKSKPPPLSKYRRKTANARERSRMKEINDAFDELRKAIPNSGEVSHTEEKEISDGDMKLTKITTLRLAMNYISALREILGFDNSVFEGSSAAAAAGVAPPAVRHGSTGSASDSSSSSSSLESTHSPDPEPALLPCSSPDSSSDDLTVSLSTCDLLEGATSPVSAKPEPPAVFLNPGTMTSQTRHHHPCSYRPQFTLPSSNFVMCYNQPTL